MTAEKILAWILAALILMTVGAQVAIWEGKRQAGVQENLTESCYELGGGDR